MKIKLITIPNLLTLSNLFFGALAVVAALVWGDLRAALLFVAASAVCDFLDGFAARLLRQTSPIGVQLDSLADDISFGLAPAAVLFVAYDALPAGCAALGDGLLTAGRYALFVVAACSALRLARFNIDTTQQEEFCGLPVPANALVCVSLGVLAAEGEWALSKVALLAVACVMSWLLVSPVRMFSLKFHGFGWRGNELRYLYLLTAALLLAAWRLRALPAVVLLYVAVSCVRWLILRARGGRGISE